VVLKDQEQLRIKALQLQGWNTLPTAIINQNNTERAT